MTMAAQKMKLGHNMTKLAHIKLIVTKLDSPHCKFDIEVIRIEPKSPLGRNMDRNGQLDEMIHVGIGYGDIELPKQINDMLFDQEAILKAEFWGEWVVRHSLEGDEPEFVGELNNPSIIIQPILR